MARLIINGQTREVDVDPDTPLLWVLRDTLGLTGTKYGCGIAQCGACTVHIDGVATRSCSVPVSAAEGTQITTIEGLPANGALHPVQRAWIAHDVPQCGYCQSGTDRRRYRRRGHQHLPLRHLRTHPCGDPHRHAGVTGRDTR
jgi:isoquinoline 1-oxidoreductase alpha subunit